MLAVLSLTVTQESVVAQSSGKGPLISRLIAKFKGKDVNDSGVAAKKKLTPYEKLFDKKNVQSDSGFVKIHNVEGKILLELSKDQLDKPLLMSSGVDKISNMSMGYIGQKVSRQNIILFSKADTVMQLKLLNPSPLTDDISVENAIKLSNVDPVIYMNPIVAISPDSSYVVDVTSFFISDSPYIANFSYSFGLATYISKFKNSLSSVNKVEVSDNSFSILTDLTYGFDIAVLFMSGDSGINMSAVVRTTVSTLPEKPIRPRLADARIGVGYTSFVKYAPDDQRTEVEHYATRWRVELSDSTAYAKGQRSDVVKPIVFYVDTLFLPSWRQAIKEGILEWNKAFEKIGFTNVIRVYDYPSAQEDSLFQSSNMNYNCVKFSPMPLRSVSTQNIYDTRSGEILNTSIVFFKDTPVTLSREAMTQLAAVEPEVINYNLPDEQLYRAIKVEMLRATGIALGLLPNYAGSVWIPTDSLRSPSFTQREGISSTVLGQGKYNYVAQKGDKERGVKLVQDELGPYDYYAIEWLYKPIPSARNAKEELPALRALIAAHENDPRYRYGKDPKYTSFLDPRYLPEIVSNDPVAAAKYGMQNLKALIDNGARVFDDREVDEGYRELFLDFVYLRLYEFMKAPMFKLGGIQINDKYNDDKYLSYEPVSKKEQKEALAFLLESIEDMSWLNNDELLSKTGLNSSMSVRVEETYPRLLTFRLAQVAFCSKMSSDSYPVHEMLQDINAFLLKDVRKGKLPKNGTLEMLKSIVSTLIYYSELPNVVKEHQQRQRRMGFVDKETFLYDLYQRIYPGESVSDPLAIALKEGNAMSDIKFFGQLSIPYAFPLYVSPELIASLKEIRGELARAIPRTSDLKTKMTYEMLVFKIYKAFGKG